MFLSIFYFWLTLSLLGVSSANLVIHSNEMTPEMSDHVIVTALKATEALPEFDDIAKKIARNRAIVALRHSRRAPACVE